MWLQYGGHIELDENPWQAIEHELLEESGYTLSQLKLLQPKDRIDGVFEESIFHPQPVYINTHAIDTHNMDAKHYHTDIGYVFVADSEPTQKIGEGESAEIILVTRAELDKIDKKEIWPTTLEICRFIFDTCLPKWDWVSL